MATVLRRVRSGFTLVELLVVITIIAFLAALLIMMFPSLATQTNEANAAVFLQGWLNIVRQKAIRNQNPYGVRLWIQSTTVGAANYYQVSECSFIEQPEDFRGGTIITRDILNQVPGASVSPWNTIAFTPGTADPTGGFAPLGDPTLYPVQIGDYVEVFGTGLMHFVTDVQPGPTPVPPQPWNPNPPPILGPILTLATPVPFQIGSFDGNGNALTATSNYRVMRLRVIGEETLPLPVGVVIDLTTNVTYGNWPLPIQPAASGGYLDVLFSPSGSVITSQLATNTMNLWVRQPDTNNPANFFAGTPTIIAVWAQTGLVAAYTPVYPPNPTVSPYMDIL